MPHVLWLMKILGNDYFGLNNYLLIILLCYVNILLLLVMNDKCYSSHFWERIPFCKITWIDINHIQWGPLPWLLKRTWKFKTQKWGEGGSRAGASSGRAGCPGLSKPMVLLTACLGLWALPSFLISLTDLSVSLQFRPRFCVLSFRSSHSWLCCSSPEGVFFS